MAQLVARLNGIEKVRGSNPLSSTSVKYLEALETLVFQGFLFSRFCGLHTFFPRLPICHYPHLPFLDNWGYLAADSFA